MGIGSRGDKRAPGWTGGRGMKSAIAVGICAALTSILAPIDAAADPLGEMAAGPEAAVEAVGSTAIPPVVSSPAVPPLPSPPVSTPQPPVKTPPVSLPPASEAIPAPKPPPAVKPPSLPSPPNASHDSVPGLGSSSEGKIALPGAASTAAMAAAERSTAPPAHPGHGVRVSPPTVSPGVALRHWFVHVWPAISLGHVGRALIGRVFDALGLGSLSAPRLFVGLLPAISGFQPTAIGSPHFGVLAEEDASKDDEPSGGPSVGPIHSNPETVAFAILAGLMALAVLALGSEFPVFHRHRRW